MPFDDVAARGEAAIDDRRTTGTSTRQYTIKGIEDQTVDRMRSAARKQGMKVGAWVSTRLREAADRALADEQEKSKAEILELKDYIRRIEENQIKERESLRSIQEELTGMIRAQHTIMARLLNDQNTSPE